MVRAHARGSGRVRVVAVRGNARWPSTHACWSRCRRRGAGGRVAPRARRRDGGAGGAARHARATRAASAALLQAVDAGDARQQLGVEEDFAFPPRRSARATGNPQFVRLLRASSSNTCSMRCASPRATRRGAPSGWRGCTTSTMQSTRPSRRWQRRAARATIRASPRRRKAPGRRRPGAQAPPRRHKESIMKILITGGTGFVGSRLARELLKRGSAERQAHRYGWCWPTSFPRPRRRPTSCATRASGARRAAAGAVRGVSQGPLRRRVPPRLGGVGRVRGRFRARACAPTSTARALLLDASRAARQRAAVRVLQLGGACSAPTPATRCRRWCATTRCRRRRPATARTSWCASTWWPTTRARVSSTAAARA